MISSIIFFFNYLSLLTTFIWEIRKVGSSHHYKLYSPTDILFQMDGDPENQWRFTQMISNFEGSF